MKTNYNGNEIIAIIALSLCISMSLVFIGFNLGKPYGTQEANLTMWETPPNMAYCVVYQDGGKRCIEKLEPTPIDLPECIRQCRISARMEKVK